MSKTFEEAKTVVLAEIVTEPPDNGMHMAWINTKRGAAERMTEESMKTILAGTEGEWDAKFEVAKLIQKVMTGKNGFKSAGTF